MLGRNALTIFSLAMSLVMLSGCMPKKNVKKNVPKGRISRGLPSNSALANSANQSPGYNTTYGGISASDQNFNYAVMLLTQPSLDGSNDQLGTVSPQPGQGGGIFFWGDSIGNPNMGNLSSNVGRLHIEIYDSYAGQIGLDGQAIQPVAIHIGPTQEGYQGVQGSSHGGQITLTFMSAYNVITMQGVIQGQQFVGNMMFSNAYTGGQMMPLGQFTVMTCGFFRCQ